tara:strand:+ start:1708 stop:1878 length:171 start_codon:yes stop_codon:yes gene_type:complete
MKKEKIAERINELKKENDLINQNISMAVNEQQKLTSLAIENNGRILELQDILQFTE